MEFALGEPAETGQSATLAGRDLDTNDPLPGAIILPLKGVFLRDAAPELFAVFGVWSL